MDLADMADIEIEEALKQRLYRQAERSSLSGGGGYALTCELCGEPIPPERHKLLNECTTCIDCAKMLEHANRLKGRNLGVWWY